MNTYKIKFACIALFALVAANAHAQSADSSSSANTNSSSVGIGQGGGSSLNNISNSSTSSVTGSSTSTSIGGLANANGGSVRNSGNSSSNSGVKGSGNSNVSVSIALAGTGSSGTGSGTDSTGASATPSSKAQTVGDPGSSPYNTNSRVEYSGTQTVKTNPAIQAPGLTTTLSDTCMGSMSIGLSLPGFGATGGTTLVDQACVRRLDAREFRAMGLTDVALALLCQSDANRRAVESTGHLCPGTTAPLAKVTSNDSNTGTVADDEKYHDPIVRQRMGLPPLAETAKYQPVSMKPAVPVQQIPAPAVPAVTQPKAADNAVVATPVVSGNTTSVAALH